MEFTQIRCTGTSPSTCTVIKRSSWIVGTDLEDDHCCAAAGVGVVKTDKGFLTGVVGIIRVQILIDRSEEFIDECVNHVDGGAKNCFIFTFPSTKKPHNPRIARNGSYFRRMCLPTKSKIIHRQPPPFLYYKGNIPRTCTTISLLPLLRTSIIAI